MNSLVFKTVTKVQVEDLYKLPSPAQQRNALKELFKSKLHQEVLADFHYSNFEYCVSNRYTLEQTSAMLGIFNELLLLAIQTRAPLSHTQQVFTELLFKHSLQRAPFSVFVFSPAEVEALRTYAQETFFKHYELYEFAFTPQQDIVVTTAQRFQASMPFTLDFEGAEAVDPATISALAEYTKEPSVNLGDVNEESGPADDEDSDDPVVQYLNTELKALQVHVQQTIGESDQQLYTKIETLKPK